MKTSLKLLASLMLASVLSLSVAQSGPIYVNCDEAVIGPTPEPERCEAVIGPSEAICCYM